MIIKIDVDGVIRDLLGAMCMLYNKEFNEKINPCDIKDYDVTKSFPLIPEKTEYTQWDYFFLQHGEDVFFKLASPFAGVTRAIEMMRENGHKVVIVTNQIGRANKVDTLNFLDFYDIPYDDICFTKDKWSIQGDYLIDDNPEFINDERDKSFKIIIDAPYNKDECKGVVRFNSLLEAAIFIHPDKDYIKDKRWPEPFKINELNVYDTGVPNCCKNCPNYNPNKMCICNCVLPYMDPNGWQVTCTYGNTWNIT